MPNTFFRFKEFTVHQDQCAMKVCTDSCLFGAWVADYLNTMNPSPESILDIGTGTGLLSLMLAQKTNALIDAVEIDTYAAKQASDNFKESKWSDRLQLINGDIRKIDVEKKYDFIISNPPFFANDLKSENRFRNIALHSTDLKLDELIRITDQYLSENGSASLLIPFSRMAIVRLLLHQNNFFIEQEVLISQTTDHTFFRVIFLFGRKETATQDSEITIKNKDRYTPEFCHLLKDYYLYL